ncbi:hypothetical protein [Cellulomonas alba]|uniref:Uncharacterized protein n=1 Tax=Cellulomonas alba TaxID=3053467 RepID=A0ABT7SHA9_9CELL|nr:hypothetical protein [Cellulomonas alba]MDM7855583.1 hypothetical protein [Cellulomonas alba]
MSSGASVDRLTALLVAATLVALWAVVSRRRPMLAIAALLVMLCFVPPWIGVNLKIFVTPLTVACLVVAIALWRTRRARMQPFDLVMVLVLGIIALSFVLGWVPLEQAYGAVVGWGIAYVAGRVAGTGVPEKRLSTAIAVAFGIVSVLVVVEFVTRHNPFLDLHMGSASAYQRWGTQQVRGGVPRQEGAFGHSIALGGSLAMAMPFVWSSALRSWLKAVTIVLVATAAVLTFSRIGIGCTALAVALCVILLRDGVSRAFRIATVTLVIVGTLVAVPLATGVFDAAGAEATDSADYRGLLVSLLPTMAWLGQSSSAAQDSAGTRTFGAFGSIDSTPILVGLNYGLAVLLILAVSAALGAVALVRGHRSPALVAVVAVLPGLTSVAFITQFTTWFWFVVGVAVSQTALVVIARPSAAAALSPPAREPDRAEFARPDPVAAVVPGGSIAGRREDEVCRSTTS